jgi:hypothetical protein
MIVSGWATSIAGASYAGTAGEVGSMWEKWPGARWKDLRFSSMRGSVRSRGKEVLVVLINLSRQDNWEKLSRRSRDTTKAG